MIACIDIGGTAIKVGVLDLQGKIVEKTSLEVNHDFNGLINSLVSFVQHLPKCLMAQVNHLVMFYF